MYPTPMACAARVACTGHVPNGISAKRWAAFVRGPSSAARTRGGRKCNSNDPFRLSEVAEEAESGHLRPRSALEADKTPNMSSVAIRWQPESDVCASTTVCSDALASSDLLGVRGASHGCPATVSVGVPLLNTLRSGSSQRMLCGQVAAAGGFEQMWSGADRIQALSISTRMIVTTCTMVSTHWRQISINIGVARQMWRVA